MRELLKWMKDHPVRASALAGWYAQGCGMATALICIPVILKNFSASESGVWFSFQAWTSFVALSNFGLGFAISRQVAFSLHLTPGALEKIEGKELFEVSPGWDGVREIFASARFLFKWVLVTAFVLLLVVYVAIWRICEEAGITHVETLCIWCGLCVSTLALLKSQKEMAFLDGLGRIYVSKFIIGTTQLLGLGLIIVSLLIYPSIALLSGCMTVGSITQLLWAKVELRRASLGKLRKISTHNPSVSKQLFRAATPMGVMITAGFFVSIVQVPLIGLLLGPGYVAPFYLAQKIGQSITGAISQITNSNMPHFTSELSKHHFTQARKRMLDNVFKVSFLAFLGTLFFIFLSSYFVELWVGSSQYLDRINLGIMGLDYFILSVTGVWGFYVLASGSNPFMWSTVLHAILNIALIFLIVPYFHLTGLVIATLLSGVLTNYFYNTYKGIGLLVNLKRG